MDVSDEEITKGVSLVGVCQPPVCQWLFDEGPSISLTEWSFCISMKWQLPSSWLLRPWGDSYLKRQSYGRTGEQMSNWLMCNLCELCEVSLKKQIEREGMRVQGGRLKYSTWWQHFIEFGCLKEEKNHTCWQGKSVKRKNEEQRPERHTQNVFVQISRHETSHPSDGLPGCWK